MVATIKNFRFDLIYCSSKNKFVLQQHCTISCKASHRAVFEA